MTMPEFMGRVKSKTNSLGLVLVKSPGLRRFAHRPGHRASMSVVKTAAGRTARDITGGKKNITLADFFK
jgi:hypothetical protein